VLKKQTNNRRSDGTPKIILANAWSLIAFLTE